MVASDVHLAFVAELYQVQMDGGMLFDTDWLLRHKQHNPGIWFPVGKSGLHASNLVEIWFFTRFGFIVLAVFGIWFPCSILCSA